MQQFFFIRLSTEICGVAMCAHIPALRTNNRKRGGVKIWKSTKKKMVLITSKCQKKALGTKKCVKAFNKGSKKYKQFKSSIKQALWNLESFIKLIRII